MTSSQRIKAQNPPLPPQQVLQHVGVNALGGGRLCGRGRLGGGLYVESGLPLTGVPIEQYLIDPPEEIELDQLDITPVGVKVIVDNGVAHILDWVGSSHYPYPADFIEEARTMGVSRKIAANTDLSQIDARSTIILMHNRAVLTNAAECAAGQPIICPDGQHRPGEPCSGLHWMIPANDGGTRRTLTNGSYQVTEPRQDQPAPIYAAGIFMVIPITALTIISHPDGTIDATCEKNVTRSGFLPTITDS